MSREKYIISIDNNKQEFIELIYYDGSKLQINLEDKSKDDSQGLPAGRQIGKANPRYKRRSQQIDQSPHVAGCL